MVVIAGNPAIVICSTEEYREKASLFALNTKGLTYEEKGKMLLSVPNSRLLEK